MRTTTQDSQITAVWRTTRSLTWAQIQALGSARPAGGGPYVALLSALAAARAVDPTRAQAARDRVLPEVHLTAGVRHVRNTPAYADEVAGTPSGRLAARACAVLGTLALALLVGTAARWLRTGPALLLAGCCVSAVLVATIVAAGRVRARINNDLQLLARAAQALQDATMALELADRCCEGTDWDAAAFARLTAPWTMAIWPIEESVLRDVTPQPGSVATEGSNRT